jgi:rhodanese-related sulfurtransferase
VVDVREEVEWALGSRIKGSVNVPISKILRFGGGETKSQSQEGTGGGEPEEVEPEKAMEIEELFGSGEATNRHPIYFVCQHGNDSQIAAERFLQAGLGRVRWVGDVRGGFVALERDGNFNP